MGTMNSMILVKPVGDTTVSYTSTYSKNEYGAEDKAQAFNGENVRRERDYKQQKKISNDIWEDGAEGSYIRIDGGNGTETEVLEGRYRYQYRTGYWYWAITESSYLSSYGTVSSIDDIPSNYETITDGIKYIYEYVWEERKVEDGYWKDGVSEGYYDENGNWIEPEWIDTSYYEYDWEEYTTVETLSIYWELPWTDAFTNSMSVIFYPRPKNFHFNNCESGRKWRVDKGINHPDLTYGLIHNLTDFQRYANQWQAWKRQTSYSSTPVFDSPLSANQINLIYSSLGGIGGYNSGDPVSASIFKGLENLIN